jgi:hypothetical protein
LWRDRSEYRPGDYEYVDGTSVAAIGDWLTANVRLTRDRGRSEFGSKAR